MCIHTTKGIDSASYHMYQLRCHITLIEHQVDRRTDDAQGTFDSDCFSKPLTIQQKLNKHIKPIQ